MSTDTHQSTSVQDQSSHEYFDFVGKTFGISKKHILTTAQKLHPNKGQTSLQELQKSLEKVIGKIERELSTLQTVVEEKDSKGTYDCIVKIIAPPYITEYYDEKNKNKNHFIQLLVVDHSGYQPMKLGLFNFPQDHLKQGKIIRLHDVFCFQSEKFGTSLRIRNNGGNIFPVPFNIKFHLGTTRYDVLKQFTADDIAEHYYSNDENKRKKFYDVYVQKKIIFDIQGIISEIGPEKQFGNSNYLRLDLAHDNYTITVKTKGQIAKILSKDRVGDNIRITAVNITNSAHEVILRSTIFSTVKKLKKQEENKTFGTKRIEKFVFPGNLEDVARNDELFLINTNVAVMGMREQKKENSIFMTCYIYDSTAICSLMLFDPEQIEIFRNLRDHQKIRLDGIYSTKIKEENPRYYLTTYLRKADNVITVFNGKHEPVYPPLSTFSELSEIDTPPKIIEGTFVSIRDIKEYQKKDGTIGKLARFAIRDDHGVSVIITTFETRHLSDLQSLKQEKMISNREE
jgi:hypothetical protein